MLMRELQELKQKSRDDFLRIDNDCMNGKIDIILTKSNIKIFKKFS